MDHECAGNKIKRIGGFEVTSNERTLFNMLAEEVKQAQELSNQLMETNYEFKKMIGDCQKLVDSCGAIRVEQRLREKITVVKDKEHEQDMNRIDQKMKRLIRLRDLEREVGNG
jgi:recombinational DNA repair protein RecR